MDLAELRALYYSTPGRFPGQRLSSARDLYVAEQITRGNQLLEEILAELKKGGPKK
jgi:hypothetical protein